ncbi:sugar transferase [Cognatishimia sp. MH4019]|uniref:sugar transferase n=1 Tax=Cognatishimia sp. MH4019 TaxID=2854030 RepID=UPI001CD3FE74|nr:sugar transferase [Cognatishimia sp. MH4019]
MQRVFELIIICFGIAILWLPMCITALIIWATLGRPLMFRQRRSGRNGEVFSILKFRTMNDTRDASGTLLPDAERQTPVTKTLRRLRLDELPQLFAVLSAKMALVGPRPLTPDTIESLGRRGVWRGRVRPGMTGWAQISGNTHLTLDEKIALDLWYVGNRSVWLDLYILMQTIAVIVAGERLRSDRIDRARAWIDRNKPSLSLEVTP